MVSIETWESIVVPVHSNNDASVFIGSADWVSTAISRSIFKETCGVSFWLVISGRRL